MPLLIWHALFSFPNCTVDHVDVGRLQEVVADSFQARHDSHQKAAVKYVFEARPVLRLFQDTRATVGIWCSRDAVGSCCVCVGNLGWENRREIMPQRDKAEGQQPRLGRQDRV